MFYSQRSDFNALMSFYDDDVQFDDIIYGNSFKNKAELRDFLNWNKGEFQALSGERILTITSQTIGNNTAVTEGYFHKFSYNGHTLGPWLFVIIHEFDNDNKIIKQTDWINYTPRKNFLGGRNINKKLTKN